MRTTVVVLALLCLGIFVPQCSSAQRGLFWMAGFELGGNLRPYSFQQKGNILDYGISMDDDDKKNNKVDADDKNKTGKHNSINTSLYYRFSRRLGIEAGIAKSFVDFRLRDSRLQNENNNYDIGNFDPSASFTSKYLALHYYTRDRYGLGIQFYFGGGIALNNLNGTKGTENHSEFNQLTNKTVSMNGRFTQNFVSPFVETGIFFYSPNKNYKSFFGLRYTMAPTLYSADYQGTQSGNVLYSDHVTATGSSFTVSYKYGLNLYKPQEQLTARGYSSSHHRSSHYRVAAKHKPEHDVTKARLIKCAGYDEQSKTSFWLYENNTRYFLEKLDSNLHRVFVRELNFKSDQSGLGKHDWVFVQNISVQDKITLFTRSGNAESSFIKITAHQFLLNGKENRSLSVFQIKGGEKNDADILWSPDSSKVSVVVFQPKSEQNKTYRLQTKTFDRELNKLYEGNAELTGIDSADPNYFFLSELCLKNTGEIFTTGFVYKKKSLHRDYHLWALRPGNKKMDEVKIELKNISSLQFKNDQTETDVVGYYNDPTRGRDLYNTFFYGKIDTHQMSVENMKASPIKDNVKLSQNPSQLHHKYVSIINHKKGAMVVTEDWIHPSQLTAMDNEGNIINTTSCNYLSFFFNDLSWFNETNHSLQLISTAHTKRLMSDQSELLASKSKRKVIPVLVTIDSLGIRTRKLLLPSDSSKIAWRPYLSFKTSDNQILIAGRESGKYRFAKSDVLKPKDSILNHSKK